MSPRSSRPSPRLVVSDDTRVPVPFLPHDPDRARYEITPLGHVYRDDGRLLRPTSELKIRLRSVSFVQPLPRLLLYAFGHPKLLAAIANPSHRLYGWHAWVPRFGEKDPLTGRRRCTVDDVVLVSHGSLVLYGQRGREPVERLSILKAPR